MTCHFYISYFLLLVWLLSQGSIFRYSWHFGEQNLDVTKINKETIRFSACYNTLIVQHSQIYLNVRLNSFIINNWCTVLCFKEMLYISILLRYINETVKFLRPVFKS